MSHIEQQRQLFKQNRYKVMKLLRWDEQQYFDFMFESAYTYLEQGMQMDEYWVRALTQVAQFWQFWRNQWNLRDAHLFLPNASEMLTKETSIVKQYKFMHSYKFITAHPTNKVFDDAYAIMIGDSFDDIKKVELCQK